MHYTELEELQKTWNGKVCLFGAGLIGKTWAYDILKEIGFKIDFYCDNNKEENLIVRDNIKTISVNSLYFYKNEVLVFITVTKKYQHSIRRQLENNGIYNIISVDYLFLQRFIESLLEMNNLHINEKFKCILNDAEYISRQFEYHMGYRPNLDAPQTFNEKIQWLKLHDRNPEYTKLVDKYEVKKYIAGKIGEQYVVPTLGIYDSFDEIDFNNLPMQFVLKCTHDSGSVMICKDKAKFDKNKAKEILEEGLKRNFYWSGREWPYKNVKPRIIAEPFLYGLDEEGFIDYKFLCMDGKVEMVFTCAERWSPEGLCVNFYDKYWNPLPFERHYRRRKTEITRPNGYEDMVTLCEKLSLGLKFIRIDFYFVQGEIYIGELTFYPGNGMEEFSPEKWDYKLGDMIKI